MGHFLMDEIDRLFLKLKMCYSFYIHNQLKSTKPLSVLDLKALIEFQYHISPLFLQVFRRDCDECLS